VVPHDGHHRAPSRTAHHHARQPTGVAGEMTEIETRWVPVSDCENGLDNNTDYVLRGPDIRDCVGYWDGYARRFGGVEFETVSHVLFVNGKPFEVP